MNYGRKLNGSINRVVGVVGEEEGARIMDGRKDRLRRRSRTRRRRREC